MNTFKVFTILGCLFLSLNLAAQEPQGPPPGGDAPGGAPGGAAPADDTAPAATKVFIITQLFSDVDANNDGYMTAEEMNAIGMTDRFFTFCDPDGDEKISLKEMEECELPEFVDVNGDGALTGKEVVEYESTSKGKIRGPGEEPAP